MNIAVTFPSGRIESYRSGTRVEEILQHREFASEQRQPVVAALVNGALVSLTYRIEVNSTVEVVELNTRFGANVYRRSLCFLLTIAAKQTFPDRRLVIGHSLGRGYFYYFDGVPTASNEDVQKLKSRMQEIVSEGCPILRKVISYSEAVLYFEKNNQPDTVLLLKNRNDQKIAVFACGDFLDLAHAPLVPNTNLLQVFDVVPYSPGFLLRYPPWNTPDRLAPFQENPVLFSIYREYKDWGKILNVRCVGHLNDLINNRQVRQFIQVAEALHDKKIALIADKICERRDEVKLILIAGPSSSGKTTFAKKLSIQLQVLGRNPFSISLDNYFLPREQTPKDEEGNYDFESLQAIDIELLNDHLLRLMRGEQIFLPRFNFHTGQRQETQIARALPDRSLIVLEGIHGLNDELTPAIPRKVKYKIYVSALTQLNLDDHNRISTTDNRLLRRIVRDSQFRGHSAYETLCMWESVRRGENKYIFPFQNTADSAFNSALDYELSVLKVYAEPLLKSVKPAQEGFNEALRLYSFLNNFVPIPPSWVPEYSILREFIGESAFKY
ncbi:MAG: nucleoside kinase [Spirochaetaceae bacterium]|nr:MAG: nucleoside kinase [Spirochaetaceae bacterium]